MVGLDIINALKAYEPIFHCCSPQVTFEDLDNLLDRDFYEISASGIIHKREDVINALIKRYQAPYHTEWDMQHFHVSELASATYLVTYKLLNGNRITYRSTIWRYINECWKVVYHQGTLANE